MKVTVERLDASKDAIEKAVREFSASGVHYADARVEVFEGKGANAFNGSIRGATEDFGLSAGVRVYAKSNSVVAAGQAGKELGAKQLESIGKELKEMMKTALKRAKLSAEQKKNLKKKYGFFGESVGKTELAPIEVFQDTVKAEFKKSPRDFSLEEVVKRSESLSVELSKRKGIASNDISIVTGLNRKIFASSEGALIDQSKALTQGFIFVAAKGKAVETFYDWVGGYAGLEVLDGANEFEKSFEDFASYLADGTIEVSNAPAMKTTSKPVTVITDPWFNALLSHEITGHPSEADRALKKETAWAGRAWWFNSMEENRIGQRVGAELLTVFSDPTLKGYGHYKYDDEGVKAKRVVHIDKGILREFLNSRETASILGSEPNGGMRANVASSMPLIRMNNTAIAPGKWKKEELFEETKEGYYLVGQKTPSIGETRQNFKITCWKLFEIKNGEIGKLYRQGGITGDSYTFFNSIDALADDFRLFNIPNSGKGTLMQSNKASNGGPHLRAKAVVSGGHVEETGAV